MIDEEDARRFYRHVQDEISSIDDNVRNVKTYGNHYWSRLEALLIRRKHLQVQLGVIGYVLELDREANLPDEEVRV